MTIFSYFVKQMFAYLLPFLSLHGRIKDILRFDKVFHKSRFAGTYRSGDMDILGPLVKRPEIFIKFMKNICQPLLMRRSFIRHVFHLFAVNSRYDTAFILP